MILADKIIELRKKNGWSQEQLAEVLGVSRQSVSKWEGAQSMPDMNRILLLSQTFGVSTDYLLHDELDAPECAPNVVEQKDQAVTEEGQELTPVSMETARAFLTYKVNSARKIALGVTLCILSVIPACVFGILYEKDESRVWIGVAVMLLMIAAAVALFVMTGMQGTKYEYLEREAIDTEYGIDGMVRELKGSYEMAHAVQMTIGIVLCIVAVIPLIAVCSQFEHQNQLMLTGLVALFVMVASGVYLIVNTSIIWGSYQMLLEEGDYSRQKKQVARKIGGIYWGIISAAYLLISFLTGAWNMTWVIWVIAGIVYSVLENVLKRQ